MAIRKGDSVLVIAGKEKGKKGKVLRVLKEKERVVIERINIVKKHTRPTQRNPKGGIIEKEGSVALSNVSLWCAKCSAGRRSKIEQIDAKAKRRVCAKCGTYFETT